jgi:hypothetical protein
MKAKQCKCDGHRPPLQGSRAPVSRASAFCILHFQPNGSLKKSLIIVVVSCGCMGGGVGGIFTHFA